MTENYARNYSDMNHPSSVSGVGAFAEFILPQNEEWSNLGFGSTVIIEDRRDDEKIWMSGQVIEIKSLSPFLSDRNILLYNSGGETNESISMLDELRGPHNEQQLIAKVKIDVELTKDNGHYVQNPIQKPASNWSRMRIPAMLENESGIPSISEILGLKKKGVEIGFVGSGNQPNEENGQFLPYYLDIEKLDNKHHFIVGESGSGKTVLLKKMAYEFRRTEIEGQKPRVIMTDVQGDLLQLMMSSIIPSIQKKGWQSKLPDTKSTADAIDDMGPFQLILPVSRGQDDKLASAIKKVVENNGHKVVEVGLRLQDVDHIGEIEYLLRLSSEQAVLVLEDEMENIASSNNQVTRDRLTGALKRRIYEADQSDGKEKQVTTSQGNKFYKSSFLAALRGLRALRDIFDHHEDSMLKNENPLNCLKFEGTSVFYLEHLDEEERLMWGMQLVKWLYENKREDGQFFVFIDEAHQLIPAKPPEAGRSGTFPRLRDNFEKLAREGRKFGINLILGTQSPRDLHPIVPQQCPTKIVMKINKGNARAAEIDEGEVRIASRFGQGQMWLKSPFNGTPENIRLHSPAPPLPHQSMTRFWAKLVDEAKRI